MHWQLQNIIRTLKLKLQLNLSPKPNPPNHKPFLAINKNNEWS